MLLWSEDTNLWLFTPAEFALLPDGFEVETINGDKLVKGKDYCDDDVRFGVLAYGVRNPKSHPEAELLTKIALSV